MIDRTRGATPWKISAAVVLLTALAACGSETSSNAGSGAPDATAEEPAFDVATASLTDEPFCDTLDTSLVAEVLGVPADQLKVLEDRKVGERFEPVEELGFQKSKENACAWGTGTSEFSVLVQPDTDAAEVEKMVSRAETMQSSGESCEALDAAEFGSPSGVLACRSESPAGGARVLATGLVGDSQFSCATLVNVDAPEDLAGQAVEACRSTLESLAEDGS